MQRGDAMNLGLDHPCLPGIDQIQSRHAAGARIGADLLKLRHLRLLRGDDQLADAPMRHAARCAIGIEFFLAGDAGARLEAARRVIEAGMDHFRIARGDAAANAAACLQHHHLTPGKRQRARDREADNARADHKGFNTLHLALHRAREECDSALRSRLTLPEGIPERMGRIDAEHGHLLGEELQLLKRAGERRIIRMALHVEIEHGGIEMPVEHVAFELGHVHAICGEAAQRLVERRRQVAHAEDEGGDGQPVPGAACSGYFETMTKRVVLCFSSSMSSIRMSRP